MFRTQILSSLIGILLLSVGLAPNAHGQRASVGYMVETVAGREVPRDAALAIDTWLDRPQGVATDASGNIFVSDTQSHRVIRIGPDGTQETYAGTGVRGFSGDGGPASEARIGSPLGLSVGPDGCLYISDNGNRRVRKVTPAGIITTVAGSGSSGSGGDGGPAADAQFAYVGAVAADAAGNLYIADTTNHRVRKVDILGIITNFAGTGTGGFSGDGGPAADAELNRPLGVAVGPGQEVYIADTVNGRVRVVDTEGNISTFAGGGNSTEDGVPTDYRLTSPYGLTVSSTGIVYIANWSGNTVVRSTASLIEKVAGTGAAGFTGDGGPALDARLNVPQDVAILEDGGNVTVFFSSSENNRVRSVTNGNITTVAGTAHLAGDGGPATEGLLDGPSGVAVDADGNLFISEERNHTVRKVNAADGTIATVAGIGVLAFTSPGAPAAITGLSSPRNVLVASNGDLLIADSGNRRVLRVGQDGIAQAFAGSGAFASGGDGGPAVEASVRAANGLAEDSEGSVYISDASSDYVRKVGGDGIISTLAGNGERGFSGDGGAATEAALSGPTGVAADAQGNIYIADSNNSGIRVVTPGGVIDTFIGGGTNFVGTEEIPASQAIVSFPGDVAVAPVDATAKGADVRGDIFYTSSSSIYRLTFDGFVSRVAGGSTGFGGDGGPAIDARFNSIRAIAVAPDGSIYVTDNENNRVRKLTPTITSINSGGVVNAAAIAFSDQVDHVAPEAIVSIFGVNLASADGNATTLPLPTDLAGVTVEVTDSEGTTRSASLFAVRGNQINCLIPAGTALGQATLTVRNPNGVTSILIEVAAVSPGLFTLSGSGQGLAAATAFRRDSQGVDTPLNVFQPDVFPFVAAPIDLGAEGDLVVLSLFGTGIRGTESSIEVTIGGTMVQVFGVAASGQFAGLDQVNVLIPRSLIGQGVVEIQMTVDGIVLNTVTITIL